MLISVILDKTTLIQLKNRDKKIVNRTHQNHTARKRFGQNFLKDTYVIDNIVAAIAPQKKDTLVEIGPGLAALTLPVSQFTDHLTVIEIDKDLVARLEMHPTLSKQLTIIEQDAMTINFNALAQQIDGKLRVFGNLPYNISTPLMLHLFHYVSDIKEMFFMLQKEVVERLVAAPNNKKYGRLTIIAQYYCQIIPVLEVPPTAFVPAPKVDSAVIKLIPHATSPYPKTDVKSLEKVTASAFGQRRKTLRNSLSSLFNMQELDDLGISNHLRAENVTIEQFCQLANYLSSKQTES